VLKFVTLAYRAPKLDDRSAKLLAVSYDFPHNNLGMTTNTERLNDIQPSEKVADKLKEALFSTIESQKNHLRESERSFRSGLQENLAGALGFLEGLKIKRPAFIAAELFLAFNVLIACAPARANTIITQPTEPNKSYIYIYNSISSSNFFTNFTYF